MPRPTVVRPAVAAALMAALSLGACASAVPSDLGGGPVIDDGFDVSDFAWSTGRGDASIQARIDLAGHRCTGSVGLVPDTPYTRSRFRVLYGSTERALVPEEVVRARNVPDPNADYRAFTRAATCSDNRFEFDDLPDGPWFLILPVVGPDGTRLVMMRRVVTRGGPVGIVLN